MLCHLLQSSLQTETRHMMRCRNIQHALVRVRKLIADVLDILNVAQHLFRHFQHRQTRRRYRHNAFAAADENLHPQLVFQ